MHHSGRKELKRMSFQVQDVPFLHGQGVEGLPFEELPQEGERLGRGDDPDAGIPPHEGEDAAGMVRFHVMDDQVVGRPAGKRLFQVFQPRVRLPGVDRIHHGHLPAQDDIRVVRHPFRNDVLTFKQIQVQVVDSGVPDVRSDAFDHTRTFSLGQI